MLKLRSARKAEDLWRRVEGARNGVAHLLCGDWEEITDLAWSLRFEEEFEDEDYEGGGGGSGLGG